MARDYVIFSPSFFTGGVFLGEGEASGVGAEGLPEIRVLACHGLIGVVILSLTHKTEILYILVLN